MPDAAEIEHYSRHADTTSDAIPAEGDRLRYLVNARTSLPPWPTAGVWVGDADAVGAQLAAFEHLAPIEGARVLQIGGNGCHGLTMAAAGAESVVQISPVVAELEWCRNVAERADLLESVMVVAALAEALPLRAGVIDAAYSPSTMHHAATEEAFPELARVLDRGGRSATVDVYRGLGYDLGIRIFGKREPVNCKPLDAARLEPLRTLPNAEVSWHGALFRYPLALMARRGRTLSARWYLRLARLEDLLTRWLPGLRRAASLVTITARRAD